MSIITYNPSDRTVTLFNNHTISLPELLRLTIIVGAYLLFRPYLLKLSQKFQERDHSRPLDLQNEHDSPAATGEGMSNLVQGEDSDDLGSDVETSGWGAKARRRKKMDALARKRLIEEEERKRAEEESDKEIEDLLEP